GLDRSHVGDHGARGRVNFQHRPAAGAANFKALGRLGHRKIVCLLRLGKPVLFGQGALLQFSLRLLTDKMTPAAAFSDVPTVVEEIRAGRMIVVVDDEDRENEGDLTLAAERVTPEAINFMTKYGRGLVCLAMTAERLDYLRIGPMTRENT